MFYLFFKKLFKDLWVMKGQVISISLVVMAGISSLVSFLSAHDSLKAAQLKFYQDSNFANIFSELKSAPLGVLNEIRDLPGVKEVEGRLVFEAKIDIPEVNEPVIGRFVSFEHEDLGGINKLFLRNGRLPVDGNENEILVNEAFGLVNKLLPGSKIRALINGRLKELLIVGWALSPEYIYALRGQIPLPNDKHFGIIWARHKLVSQLFSMEGAFNSIIIRTWHSDLQIAEGSSYADSLLIELDKILNTYGSRGAYERKDQQSHFYISEEIKQQKVMATVVPFIFLMVSAFLVNLTISRLMATHREQIATLKSLGFYNFELFVFYLFLIMAIILIGALAGVFLGIWQGGAMVDLYLDFFKFPELPFLFSNKNLFISFISSVAAALVGGFGALKSVVQLNPAEAMRPPMPESFRENWTSKRLDQFSPILKMNYRSLLSKPVRTFLSIFGLSMAFLVLIMGFFWKDSLDYMLDFHFEKVSREDVMIVFNHPLSGQSINELMKEKAIVSIEEGLFAEVQISRGYIKTKTSISGVSPKSKMRRALDLNGNEIPIVPGGIIISEAISKKLDVYPGQNIEVKFMDGDRKTMTIPVVSIVGDLIGFSCYMNIDDLRNFLNEKEAVNTIYAKLDWKYSKEFIDRIKRDPEILMVDLKRDSLNAFNETSGKFIIVFSGILVLFAMIISIGVVYNCARISLSEKTWSLATLRVLGFYKLEVFRILGFELILLIMFSTIPGFLLGYFGAYYSIKALETEAYRLPFFINASTYFYSLIIVYVSAILSTLLIYRRVAELDLVAVLKARE